MRRKKNDNNSPKKRFGTWIWLFCAVFTSVLLGIVYLFFSPSRAYHPPETDKQDEVNSYITHYLAQEIYNRSQEDDPFELLIDQDKLNEALNQFNWPQQLGDLSFSNPYAVFGEDKIYIMAELAYKDFSTVITVTMAPALSENQQLCLNIKSVRMGQLPATTVLTMIAKKYLEDNRAELQQQQLDIEVTEAIINNRYFDAVIYLYEKPLKITGLTATSGLLKATLDPIRDF